MGALRQEYRGKQINPHYYKSKEDANLMRSEFCI